MVEKSGVERSGVENSGVELSYNLSFDDLKFCGFFPVKIEIC